MAGSCFLTQSGNFCLEFLSYHFSPTVANSRSPAQPQPPARLPLRDSSFPCGWMVGKAIVWESLGSSLGPPPAGLATQAPQECVCSLHSLCWPALSPVPLSQQNSRGRERAVGQGDGYLHVELFQTLIASPHPGCFFSVCAHLPPENSRALDSPVGGVSLCNSAHRSFLTSTGLWKPHETYAFYSI